MELLIPAVGGPATTRPLHFPRWPTAALFSPTTILSFKNTPLISSSNSFPKLASISRTAPISARASPLVDSLPAMAPVAFAAASPSTRWMVTMEKPPNAEVSSKAEIIDYYVRTLARVLPSEKEAQMCIYRASWKREFFFCCDTDEDVTRLLACVPEVISVRPDSDVETAIIDSSAPNLLDEKSSPDTHASRFSPPVTNGDYWLVKMEKPGVEVVSKAQMVDYFAQALTKVLGNEKDAQVSIYNVSWERDFGFCCQIDEECAHELSDVPGVLSVQPDVNFDSDNKNYKGGDISLKAEEMHDSTNTSSLPNVKTKRLFVTGLSFYTSEKTLRAAFEAFGELVEVKIIMDKISKRSKGYAFLEYTTEEAAGAALKEMNGKIINGWMIVVDVAKTNPPKYNRGRPSLPSSSTSLGY